MAIGRSAETPQPEMSLSNGSRGTGTVGGSVAVWWPVSSALAQGAHPHSWQRDTCSLPSPERCVRYFCPFLGGVLGDLPVARDSGAACLSQRPPRRNTQAFLNKFDQTSRRGTARRGCGARAKGRPHHWAPSSRCQRGTVPFRLPGWFPPGFKVRYSPAWALIWRKILSRCFLTADATLGRAKDFTKG